MTKTGSEAVDDYIASQPIAAQVALQSVRSTIRKALPEADEVISYSMPAYKQHGRIVLYFAGWTHHFSLYPAGAGERLAAAFKDQLAPYTISKGTIRFPLAEPVPVNLIEGISRFCANEASQREKKKQV